MTTTDPTLQRIFRRDALKRRERTIVTPLLTALDCGDWDTVHRCDRALGRVAANKGVTA
jgi:hypothetical protein